MKKILNVFFGFLLVSIFFTFCTKRVFYHVGIKGTLIDFFTSQPVKAHLELYTQQPALLSKSSILKTTDTKDDGSFELKSKAIWKKEYYLDYKLDDNSLSGLIFGGRIENKDNIDLGTVFTDHKFNCALTLNSISSNTLSLIYLSKIITLQPGTNTLFFHSTQYSKSLFEKNNSNYIIEYIIDSSNTNYYRNLKIPISSSSNLTATLNF